MALPFSHEGLSCSPFASATGKIFRGAECVNDEAINQPDLKKKLFVDMH